MRDRLIELTKASLIRHIDKTCKLAENITDDLLASGVIVPPCKVGDTVYHYCSDLGGVFPYFVENLNIGYMDKERNYWTYEANCHDEETDELLDEIDFDYDDIGKTVFLTHEEAEKALKGGVQE